MDPQQPGPNDVLRFPAIGLLGETVESYRADTDFTACSWRAYSSGYYDTVTLVDCDGTVARPRSVVRASGLVASVLGRVRVRVALAVESTPLPLAELKRRVVSTIERDPEFWEAAGPVEDLAERVRGASCYRDIVDMFV